MVDYSYMIHLARKIAKKFYEDEKHIFGEPYMVYLTELSKGLYGEARVVAYLHDILINTSLDISDLYIYGFSENVVKAIKLLSGNSDNYLAYIQKIKANSLAKEVKIHDLVYKLDFSKNKNITKEDSYEYKKYQKALILLKEYKKREPYF